MRQLKNWDNRTWLSSNKYISSFHNFIKAQSKINKKTNILEIGCGRANIIGFLQKKYKFNNRPIGIDIVKNKNIKSNIIFKKSEAISYLKNSKKNFDLILIKQTIHFFTKKKIKILLELAKKSLSKNGQILIFSLKTVNNEIPSFKIMKSKLLVSLKKDKNLIKEIKKNLKKYKKNNFSFKVVVSKNTYVRMVKERYISCLLNISNKEIKKGIHEIKSRYEDKIKFTDTLNCIAYKK